MRVIKNYTLISIHQLDIGKSLIWLPKATPDRPNYKTIMMKRAKFVIKLRVNVDTFLQLKMGDRGVGERCFGLFALGSLTQVKIHKG